jgi:hypothetical protein
MGIEQATRGKALMARKTKYEETIDGTRVRVYATRSELECLIGDGDIADPEQEVWVYPKIIGPYAAAHQAILDRKHT